MTVIIEDVLRQLLIATDVAATRVFVMRAPQKPAEQMKTPYIVFFQVGPSPMHSQTGPLDLLDREYQVSIFDPSQSRALGIADELRRQLDGLRGDYMGLRFGAIFFRVQTSAFEATPEIVQVVTAFRVLFTVLDDFGAVTLNPRNQPETLRSKLS
jgi:hypothetical protein